jgi:hypothetical protein
MIFIFFANSIDEFDDIERFKIFIIIIMKVFFFPIKIIAQNNRIEEFRLERFYIFVEKINKKSFSDFV